MSANFKYIGDGVYKRGDKFYFRPTKPDGRRTFRALRTRTKKAARERLREMQGPADTNFTVGEALRSYRNAGCPDKKRQPRTGDALIEEQSRCDKLLKYWKIPRCSSLTVGMIDDYADWRIKHSAKGHGGRAADLDIVTLKNAIRWAARRGNVRENPFDRFTVTSYREPYVRHCREVAPASGDELHALAGWLLEERRSAILGWLTLITAMVGGRVSEMTALRMDAAEGEPGAITDDILWLRRRKKGVHNFSRIHPDLRRCLDAFFLWRSNQPRFKNSPWWFPGRNPKEAVKENSLTHALARVGQKVCNARRTAHGLRSFHVTCLRSQGKSDPEIALEHGQVSGGREIVRTYGEPTPRKVHWMPESGEPAWAEIYHAYTQPLRNKPDSKRLININFTRKNKGSRPDSVSTGLAPR